MLKKSDCTRFATAMAELGIVVRKELVEGHSNSLQDFTRSWGRPQRVYHSPNGIDVHIWKKLREKKSGTVSDVYAADFGTERAFLIRNHAPH